MLYILLEFYTLYKRDLIIYSLYYQYQLFVCTLISVKLAATGYIHMNRDHLIQALCTFMEQSRSAL